MRLFSFRKSSLHITEATAQDAKNLAVIHAKSFAKSWDATSFVSLINQPTNHCLLAHLEGNGTDNPVGFVLFRIVGDEAEIITVCSDPNYRGNGIGRRLMTDAILRVHTDRANQLFLEVDESNSAAVSLYKSLGMKIISTRQGYYKNLGDPDDGETLTRSNALVMALNLG